MIEILGRYGGSEITTDTIPTIVEDIVDSIRANHVTAEAMISLCRRTK